MFYLLFVTLSDGCKFPLQGLLRGISTKQNKNRLDSAKSGYLAAAHLNFVVLDDGSLDPRAPAIGKASVALSSMVEDPSATLNTVAELQDYEGQVTGQIVLSLKWIRSNDAVPLYIQGL